MVSRPRSRGVLAAANSIGEQMATWRKLLGLTTTQVAERAGIALGTLARVEHGDPGVSLAGFLAVAQALGQLDRIVTATDPYETDLGRARADDTLPKRVRK